MLNKLKSVAGESLIETLAALMITCLGLTLLPGAIIAAARVNSRAEKINPHVGVAEADVTDQIQIHPGSGSPVDLSTNDSSEQALKVYKDAQNDYYYYRYEK